MKIAACILVLSACVGARTPADEPQKPAAAPQNSAAGAQTASAADAQTASPAAAAKKTEKAKAANGGATEAQIKLMRSRGYKPQTRNGTTVFCRSESEIGTHFEHTHCNTLEELSNAELNGKDFVNSIQQQGSPTPFKGP